jgi:hypothetical protein
VGAIPVGTRKIKVRLGIDQVSGTIRTWRPTTSPEIDPGNLGYLTFAQVRTLLNAGRSNERNHDRGGDGYRHGLFLPGSERGR